MSQFARCNQYCINSQTENNPFSRFQFFNCYFMSDLKNFCHYCPKKCATELTLIYISTDLPRLLLSETANSTETLLSQSVILITRLKSGVILLWGRCKLIFDKIFPKNATFKFSLSQKFHPFLHSTHQEYMIFAKIGDGPCYYHWNEDCTGVWGLLLNRIIFS